MSYILKIPIYKTNKGRGDNGNTILEISYVDKQKAIDDRDFLNGIFNRDADGEIEDLPEDMYNRMQEILDWEGYQIKDAYVVEITETRI
jgi:hypothetical protein